MNNFYSAFPQKICEIVWDEKYRYRDDAGNIIDQTPTDTFLRIHRALFANESKHWQDLALEYLLSGVCLPAGRIISGAGSGPNAKVTMINCFVNQDIPDSMHGITQTIADTAISMSEGGGVGTAFGTLRPDTAIVRGKRTWSSGVLPFLDWWDQGSQTIRSAGERRGAMMATLPCDHPDVIHFVTAKSKEGRLKHFNVSVLITDAFMRAVRDDTLWQLGFWVPKKSELGKQIVLTKPVVQEVTAKQLGVEVGSNAPWYVYQTLPARELWDLILRTTYEFAEPGIIFIDRVNQLNPLSFAEHITSSNPCGEQMLPPHGSCNLGAVSLPHLVENAFTPQVRFDFDKLQIAVRVMVRLLDNVLDVSRYPLSQQQEESFNKRRIGLGITGLGDTLAMLGIRYGSLGAIQYTDALMKLIANTAYSESSRIALDKGSCPIFLTNFEQYVKGEFFQRLDAVTRQEVRDNGLRNGVLLTVAPTGTTSILNGNVSSGIEPIFAYMYKRKIIRADTSTSEEMVYDFAVLEYERITGKKFDPENPPTGFVCTADLTVKQHVEMQATAQHWIDSSISKTINCPKEMTFDQFMEVYDYAYTTGCKSCTTYRPSDVRGSVLTAVTKSDTPPSRDMLQLNDPHKTKLARPFGLMGATYKIKYNETNYYLTLNHLPDGRPAEIFIESLDVTNEVWRNALCRALSALMRQNINITFLLDDMKQLKDPFGGAWGANGVYYASLPQAIAHLTDAHFSELLKNKSLVVLDHDWGKALKSDTKLPPCSKCGMNAVKHENGCDTCMSCGFSNCS